ncbi:MAG TPA: rod shape-determining protein MreC [Bacilli bacterium]|nr:rod shape-determining protein MreC [Bacilli bacterium]
MKKIIKSKKNNKIIYITIIILIFIFFVLINIFDINTNVMSFIRTPFTKVYSSFYNTETSSFNDERVASLNDEIVLLKESLGLKEVFSEYDLVFATAIYRDPTYWQESLIIDKGKDYNLKENMAVVTSKGLIGKISRVNMYNSVVSLITDSKNNISVGVKSSEGYIHGLITDFDFENNLIIVSGINNYDDVYENSKIITTGINNTFPSGLLVGYVKDIKSSNYDISKKLYVKSNQNLDDIRYVAVLMD